MRDKIKAVSRRVYMLRKAAFALAVLTSSLLILAPAPTTEIDSREIGIAIAILPQMSADDHVAPKHYRVMPYVCDVLVSRGDSNVALGGPRVVLTPGETRHATTLVDGITTDLTVKIDEAGRSAKASVRVLVGDRVLASQRVATALIGRTPPGGR
jgi:hypothetical protein